MRLHILHSAAEGPIFGLGIIDELRYQGNTFTLGLHESNAAGFLHIFDLAIDAILRHLTQHDPEVLNEFDAMVSMAALDK